MVAIRVIAAPLLGVARARQVLLMTKKLPVKQVQHFVEQHCGTVERVRGGPERRAQRDGISWKGNESGWRIARGHERSGGSAIIGSGGAADMRHAGTKSVGHGAKAVGDQVCGEPIVRPWHGPRRISEEGMEQAHGFLVARLELGGGIVCQPNCVLNRTADDGTALVGGMRPASGAAGVTLWETKSRDGRSNWLGEGQVLSKM